MIYIKLFALMIYSEQFTFRERSPNVRHGYGLNKTVIYKEGRDDSRRSTEGFQGFNDMVTRGNSAVGGNTDTDMKTEHWKRFVIKVTNDKNEDAINLLSEMLEEYDETKQLLRDKGYGILGVSLLQTVKEVPEVYMSPDKFTSYLWDGKKYIEFKTSAELLTYLKEIGQY